MRLARVRRHGDFIRGVVDGYGPKKYEFIFSMESPATLLFLTPLEKNAHEVPAIEPLFKQVDSYLKERLRGLAFAGARDDESIQVVQRPSMKRNARVQKIIGVAHSNAPTLAFATDINQTVAVLAKENWDFNRSPMETDREVLRYREIGDRRFIYVILEGSPRFIQRYLAELEQPDAIVVVASEPVLSRLGIRIVDEGWKKGDPPMNLGKFLWGEKAAARPGDNNEAKTPNIKPSPPPPKPTPIDDSAPPLKEGEEPGEASKESEKKATIEQRYRPSKEEPPSEVQRSASSVEMPSVDPPPVEGEPSTPEAEDEFDRRLAEHVTAHVEGNGGGDGSIGFKAGERVRDVTDGTEGVVKKVEGPLAYVEFDGEGVGVVPVAELEGGFGGG